MLLANASRTLRKLVSYLVASTLGVYTGCPFNILDYLGTCTDAALICWIALTRLSLLLLMWMSRTAAPVVFHAPGNSFIFDTGEELYDDGRFAMVRQWDGVHMFFIAHYGYLYENQLVFFPGLPALIRGVQYVTHHVLPLLHRLAPVAFYICVINVVASCVAGVLLRRLATLTFLGPEAVQRTCWWWRQRIAAKAGHALTRRELDHVTDAVVRYRLSYGLTGTTLDMDDPLTPRPATQKDITATVRRHRRVIGGAALVWIVTPAMVFTVAVYTESLFALTTILGIYCLAWYDPLPWALQERVAEWLAPTVATPNLSARRARRGGERTGEAADRPDTAVSSPTRRAAEDDLVAPPLEELLSELTGGSQLWPRVVWRQAFVTRAEVAAVLLFTLAATLRSNAFTCAGFLGFPLVIQAVLPELYAAQCRTTLAGPYASAILAATPAPGAPTAAVAPTRSAKEHSEDNDVPSRRHTAKSAEAETTSIFRTPSSLPSSPSTTNGGKIVVCDTLTCPQRRTPHPLRVLVLVFECALLLAPYMTINYLGYHRFVTRMWKPAARAQIGAAFWQLYPMLQKKYWNVSFLSAYTFTNLPNVILAMPVAVLIVLCTYSWYLAPAWAARAGAGAAATATGAVKLKFASSPSRWSRFCRSLVPLIRSSNVVHLLALLALALSTMHVQVTNRFVMSSPALYFLLGSQLAARPTSVLSQLILLWSVLWSIMGGVLFANHQPWT